MDKIQFKDAVKQAIDTFGVEIIKSPSFVNVLADYGAFATPKGRTVKSILKGLISDEFGLKVLDWLKKHPSDWRKQNDDYIWDFVNRGQYDKDLVFELTNAILYSIGLLSESDKTTEETITDPWQELDEAKQAYNQNLEKLITKGKDCLGLKTAFYEVEACNELYYFEGKIALLSRFLNVSDADWCKTQKQSCLAKHRSTENESKSVAKNTIKLLSSEYERLLSKDIVRPKGLFNRDVSYYEETTISKLDEMAIKLRKAQRILKETVTFDSITDRQSRINIADKRRKKIRRVLYIIIATFVVSVVLFAVSKIRYFANKQYIVAAESKISEGDSLVNLKRYEDAYNSYIQGLVLYQSDYRKRKYQLKVDGKIETLGDISVTDFENRCGEHIAAGKFVPIEDLISILPVQILNDDRFANRIQKQKSEYQIEAEANFKDGYSALLNDISKNHGKLSVWGQNELIDLLLYKPNDYWLSFIQKRTKKE